MKKIFWFRIITFMLAFSAVALAYMLVGVGYRTYHFYSSVKQTRDRGWEGVIHRSDAMLGFEPIPGAEGYEILPDGRSVMKVVYDENGCRVPWKDYGADPSRTDSGPRFLFLGCSFTFGSACPAKSTFPFLVAEHAGGTAVNAGVISYGFPQMILRARELVPKVRPNFVVLQSSPWLVTRGTSMYRPTRYGMIPVPYFTRTDEGYAIAPPVYRSNLFDLPIRDFINDEKNLMDFADFYLRVGVPFYVYSDLRRAYARAGMFLGFIPAPASPDISSIERYVYGEISRICAENNSVLIVLTLLFSEKHVPEPLVSPYPDILFVFPDKALVAAAEREEAGYDVLFKHSAVNSLTIVDSHPNARAHRIIAEEINKAVDGWIFRRQRRGAPGGTAADLL